MLFNANQIGFCPNTKNTFFICSTSYTNFNLQIKETDLELYLSDIKCVFFCVFSMCFKPSKKYSTGCTQWARKKTLLAEKHLNPKYRICFSKKKHFLALHIISQIMIDQGWNPAEIFFSVQARVGDFKIWDLIAFGMWSMMQRAVDHNFFVAKLKVSEFCWILTNSSFDF